MKNRILPFLILLIAGIIGFAVQAQQKKGAEKINLSGEWKAKESISMGGNIVCSYDQGDRMLSKTMTLTERANALMIEVPNPAAVAPLNTSREILTFDGRETEINHEHNRGRKFTAHLSADKKTITVKSIVHLTTATPGRMNEQQPMLVYVTEVWKLSNDGKTISIQTTAKSSLLGEERNWETVFNRVG
ncbi:hypothetical protein [Jiulongibacter sediminis]|uniref:Uncharacterized protein n=1 Tax=Jiulongibacter sediminis TaxID=1605367 RepID=A0A0N8H9R3_9BACT|nr:hypothetical protein [Jiulongibacter sediminis]KPM48092.1 hypothetical protein AFM12_12965 [Jiulongibacter sediminis]TBX24272.1 hypothetical protein TK44_12975 [Jiulongibacter sediminis]